MRWDHRHHLLDAIVAACTTRSDVQRLQTFAARNTGEERASEILAQVRYAELHFENVGICWQDGFREIVKAFLEGRRPAEAADKTPATAVVVKADHDPRDQLHEATNYGLICEIPGEREKYVARDHAAISELKWEQIEKLGVPKTALAAVERAMNTGTHIWWGGNDPALSLRNVDKDLANLRAALLELMKEAPTEVVEKARTDGGRKEARGRWAISHYIEKTGRRRFMRVRIVSLRILKGPIHPDKKPRQANPCGGNDRLVYFTGSNGNRDIEVVSTLDANTPGFRERWRCEGGRLLFVLRKDDLVEMISNPKAPASSRRIFRTVSFSAVGSLDLEFLPVEEDRAPKQVPKQVRTRISSVKAFNERRPEMILCDATGRERWRSPRLN